MNTNEPKSCIRIIQWGRCGTFQVRIQEILSVKIAGSHFPEARKEVRFPIQTIESASFRSPRLYCRPNKLCTCNWIEVKRVVSSLTAGNWIRITIGLAHPDPGGSSGANTILWFAVGCTLYKICIGSQWQEITVFCAVHLINTLVLVQSISTTCMLAYVTIPNERSLSDLIRRNGFFKYRVESKIGRVPLSWPTRVRYHYEFLSSDKESIVFAEALKSFLMLLNCDATDVRYTLNLGTIQKMKPPKMISWNHPDSAPQSSVDSGSSYQVNFVGPFASTSSIIHGESQSLKFDACLNLFLWK
jgi:hypothetical protein